jgi:hypothetical protein
MLLVIWAKGRARPRLLFFFSWLFWFCGGEAEKGDGCLIDEAVMVWW